MQSAPPWLSSIRMPWVILAVMGSGALASVSLPPWGVWPALFFSFPSFGSCVGSGGLDFTRQSPPGVCVGVVIFVPLFCNFAVVDF